MKARKVTAAQENRARREMLAAVEVYRRQGVTREAVLAMAGAMYDFQARWAETAARIRADATSGEGRA